jgi:tetraacyldisaccharide 4'-kinase
MKIATPRWWYSRAGPTPWLLQTLLRPISLVWAWSTAHRIATIRPIHPGVPVVCIGDLTVGGVGKTPVVRELARLMSGQGIAVHVLSRGYGGQLAGPVRVDVSAHTARGVGDEPLMMASDTPVWISRDRLAGARAMVAAGAEVILMDDGHQNPILKKALSLVVVDGETRDGQWPFGCGAVFPCGPMREPLESGLERADAVVVVLPADVASPDLALLALLEPKPVLVARLLPKEPPPTGPVLAFAAIGKPWKFERALRAAGCNLVGFSPMADHAPLSERALKSLDRVASDSNARLLTTEKDWIRLPTAWRGRVTAWPVRVRFEDEDALGRLMASALT